MDEENEAMLQEEGVKHFINVKHYADCQQVQPVT
jgi:hypothetical protein